MPPALAPELMVSDLAESLRLRRGLCGFSVAWERPEEGFACLDLGGARVMHEQADWPGRRWRTAPLERPFGGINLEVGAAVAPILAALDEAGWPLFLPVEEVFYRVGAEEVGVRQFLVPGPDGYLRRFQKDVRRRPAA